MSASSSTTDERTDSADEACCTAASSSPVRECNNSTDDDLIHDLTDLSLYEKKPDIEVKDTALEAEAEGLSDKQDGGTVSKSARKRLKKAEKATALLAGIVEGSEDNERAGTDHITANLSSSSFSFLFAVKAEWAQHDRSEYADGATGQTQRKRARAARLLNVDLLRRTKQSRPDPARLLRARQLRDSRLSEASRAKLDDSLGIQEPASLRLLESDQPADPLAKDSPVAITTSSTAHPTDEALRKQLLAASQKLAALKKDLATERKGKATVDRKLTAMTKQTHGVGETTDIAKELAALQADNVKLRAERSSIQSKLDKAASSHAAIQGGLQKKLDATLKELESVRASPGSKKPSQSQQEDQKLLAEIKALKGERAALMKRLQAEGEAAKRRKVEAAGTESALREAKETIKALQAKEGHPVLDTLKDKATEQAQAQELAKWKKEASAAQTALGQARKELKQALDRSGPDDLQKQVDQLTQSREEWKNQASQAQISLGEARKKIKLASSNSTSTQPATAKPHEEAVQVADAKKEAEELRKELLSVTKSRDQWKASAAKHQSRLDIELNNAKKAAEERAVIAAANITLRVRLEKEKKAHIEGQSMAEEAAARIEP